MQHQKFLNLSSWNSSIQALTPTVLSLVSSRGILQNYVNICLNRLLNIILTEVSHVFTCFVDFTKAFDYVNYWQLLCKLLEDGVSSDIVALLNFWYSHKLTSVCWKSTVSSSFHCTNGTRQGSILSPLLCKRYIRDLLATINGCNIGCCVGGRFLNIFAYADDIVLLAPSLVALQYLINVLHSLAKDIDMSCNVTKTVCMMFKPTCKRLIVTDEFPSLTVGGVLLHYVTEFKYLGHIITNNLLDDADIKREMRLLFARTNMLLRRYGKCFVNVKLALFRSFCMCFVTLVYGIIILSQC